MKATKTSSKKFQNKLFELTCSYNSPVSIYSRKWPNSYKSNEFFFTVLTNAVFISHFSVQGNFEKHIPGVCSSHIPGTGRSRMELTLFPWSNYLHSLSCFVMAYKSLSA
jgi:hypothetical protein